LNPASLESQPLDRDVRWISEFEASNDFVLWLSHCLVLGSEIARLIVPPLSGCHDTSKYENIVKVEAVSITETSVNYESIQRHLLNICVFKYEGNIHVQIMHSETSIHRFLQGS
jgi:hypothetical protein